jgi:hypothetical protein
VGRGTDELLRRTEKSFGPELVGRFEPPAVTVNLRQKQEDLVAGGEGLARDFHRRTGFSGKQVGRRMQPQGFAPTCGECGGWLVR